MLPFLHGLIGSIVSGVSFLLRDDFTTPEAAPITSPRTCEPGPGLLTIADTGNNISISSDEMVISGGVSNWSATGFYSAGLSRASGLMLLSSVYLTSGTHAQPLIWRNATGMGTSNVNKVVYNFYNTSLSGLALRDYSYTVSGTATLSGSTAYSFINILRSTGSFFLIKGGAFTEWTIIWVSFLGSAATLYPGIGNFAMVLDLPEFRVAQLAAPWDTDNGIATDEEAGDVPVSTTFTHEADCLIEFEATTLPSSGNTKFLFRLQDAINSWDLFWDSLGHLRLYEQVAGGFTERAAKTYALSGGERIVIVCDDETITVYYDNTLAFSYSSAANFKAKTDGEVAHLGTGGAISDLITWPRTLSGSALTELEKYTT